jgi:hypothetical protein
MGLPGATLDLLRARGLPYVVTLLDFWWFCANAQLVTNFDHTVCSGPAWWTNCTRCAVARSDSPLAWAASPLLLLADPTLLGIFEPAQSMRERIDQVGWMWLVIGVAGLLFRTVHLFFLQGVEAGLAWMTKILTDPFHDIKLYYRAPLHLLQGRLIDPSPDHQRG